MHELIHDLALSIVMAWLLGVAANFDPPAADPRLSRRRLPAGPSGFKWVQSEQSINTIAELGLIFMLFMIGLEIDLKKIVRAGNVILVTSAAQIFGCFVLALGCFSRIGLPLGDRRFDALYLAAAVSLQQHRHHRQGAVRQARARHAARPHHARRAGAAGPVRDPVPGDPAEPERPAFRRRAGLGDARRRAARRALLISRYTLPHLFHLIARLPELVLVGALAWCFAVAEFAEFLGLSREMGALVAGVSLSTFPYALDVTAKVRRCAISSSRCSSSRSA